MTAQTPTPAPRLNGGVGGRLDTALTLITDGTRKAGAAMPTPITDAWTAADTTAARIAATITDDGRWVDTLLDAADQADDNTDPFTNPAVTAALLRALTPRQAFAARVRTRTEERKWAALYEHRDALHDTWATAVARADAALTAAAEILRTDDLANSVAIRQLGGSAASTWGAALEHADKLNALDTAWRTLGRLLGHRTTKPGTEPLWLADLNADQLHAWDNRPREYRSAPGGAAPTWAVPWWLARHGIHLTLPTYSEMTRRITAVEQRHARLAREAKERRDAYGSIQGPGIVLADPA
jgi:hypothetical protein